MAAPLISDVFDRSRALLNDTGILSAIAVYTNDALLPFVKMANDELSDYMIKNGIPVQNQVELDILVDAGDLFLTLPADFIVPVKLWEKGEGAPRQDYVSMDRRAWDPNVEQTQNLNVWEWRNQHIYFPGATTNREVRLDYIRMLTSISNGNTAVEVIGAINFLACKTAELAVDSIGQNPIDAAKFRNRATEYRDNLLAIGVRNNQAIQGRRKPYRLRFLRR